MIDFDGDDDFDEIDVAILEEEENKKKESDNNSGCCVVFLAIGTSITLVAWSITHYMI